MSAALRLLNLPPLTTRGAPAGPAQSPHTQPAPWTPADWAGRIVEVTGSASSGCTTFVAHMVAAAQREGEPTAWLQLRDGSLYPPDLAALGVDLQALLVGLLPDGAGLLQAADILLRSGSWGLVVLDPDTMPLAISDAQLGRLLGLCQKHAAALVLLSRQAGQQRGTGPAFGSLVSLRLEVSRPLPGQTPALHTPCPLTIEAVKDKRRGPGKRLTQRWAWPEDCVDGSPAP